MDGQVQERSDQNIATPRLFVYAAFIVAGATTWTVVAGKATVEPFAPIAEKVRPVRSGKL